MRPPLTFAFYTGWRVRSEILSLAWDRVDLEAQAVRLYRGSTKNKDGRLVRLPQVLMAILEAQWQEHRHLFPTCDWVFHRQGEPIKPFYKTWNRACAEAGIATKRIPHNFRRTAVRNLVRAGVPERVAMAVTGFKTRSVFERYNIVSEGDLEEAARRIDQQIASRIGTTLGTITPHTQTEHSLSH